MLKTYLGETIYFPDFIKHSDSIDFLIVSYVDSIGCTSCRLDFAKWNELQEQIEANNASVLFCIQQSRDTATVKSYARRQKARYPIFFDKKDSFSSINRLATEVEYQTLLLDKDNKVLAIGNPILNPKVKELYLKIIKGEKIGREDGSRQIVTQASIDRTTVSLGSFGWQEEQKATFTLKNTGDKPLVIEDITTSCGCTTVAYSKEPVQPGRETTLEVAYKAEHPGHFDKTVTVYCNTDNSPLRLKISGDAKQMEKTEKKKS